MVTQANPPCQGTNGVLRERNGAGVAVPGLVNSGTIRNDGRFHDGHHGRRGIDVDGGHGQPARRARRGDSRALGCHCRAIEIAVLQGNPLGLPIGTTVQVAVAKAVARG